MLKRLKMLLSSISIKFTTKISYYYTFREKLDLINPRGINQKLQYLKLYDYYNNDVITQCVDKFRVRSYLQNNERNVLCAPLLSELYTDANQLISIWPELPNQFVIKCNHGCGYNIIVENKNVHSLKKTIKQIKKWLNEDYWKINCEPQYKFVEKGFFVEEFLSEDIKTYKFYCFNGIPKVLYVSSNGEDGEKDKYVDYFDLDWNRLPITLSTHAHITTDIPKPTNFEVMKRIASQLSQEFPFVRIDLYDVNGEVYFSEYTFIPTGGKMKLNPPNVIEEWGNWLKL